MTGGRAAPSAAKEGTSCTLLDRAGLEQRGWPAPTRHTRSTVTEGLGRALARPTQPVHRPWSPSGRRRGSEVPVSRPRAWRSAAARLPAAAAGWAKSINPLLRHEVEAVHRLGSLGYQTGLVGASADDQRTGYVHDPVPTDEVAAECHRVDPHTCRAGNFRVAATHCLPTPQLSHRVSMLLYRFLFASPYNGSITVRTPAPCDHRPHSFDTACPERPKPAPLSPAAV